MEHSAGVEEGGEQRYRVEKGDSATVVEVHEVKASDTRIFLIVAIVTLSYVIVNLDGSSAALSTIGKALNASALQLAWVYNAFTLLSTPLIPLWSKLADAFGQRNIVLFGLITFLAGSAGAGAASSMAVLGIFRGVQGLGNSAIVAMSLVIFTEYYPIHKRGFAFNIIGAAMGFTMILGPIVGGSITDNASMGWRWSYWILLPLTGLLFPLPAIVSGKADGANYKPLKNMDYLGFITLVGTTACILLALAWGGKQYNWASGQIIGLFVAGGVFAALFILVEIFVAKEPVFPPYMFRSLNNNAVFVMNFFQGGAAMAFMMFGPMYYKGDLKDTALQSAVDVTLAINLAWMVFGIISSQLLRYVPANILVIIGTGLTTIGTGLFSLAISQGVPSKGVAAIYLIIFGAGQGLSTQNSFLIAQAHLEKKQDSKLMSNIPVYFHRVGGSILVAILSAIYSHENSAAAAAAMPSGSGNMASTGMDMGGGSTSNSTMPASGSAMRMGNSRPGTTAAFRWAILFAGLSFLASFALKKTWIIAGTRMSH